MTRLPTPPAPPDGIRPPRLPGGLIPALLVALLALSAAGLVAYARQETRELRSRLAFGASRAQRAVAQWEQDELERAKRWGEDPSIGAASGVIPSPLAALAKHASAGDGIRAVALFSPQGALLASTAPELLTDPMLGQRIAAIQRARSGTASVAGPIWPSASRDGSEQGRWLLISATPVRDAAGTISAVLAFFHDTDAPLRRVRFAVRSDSSADVYLIDEKGMLLSGLAHATGPEASVARAALSTPAARQAEGMALRPYVGPAGRAVMGAWASAAPLAARVVFEVDARPTTASLPLPLGYLLAALLGVAIVLVLVQQRGVARLRRESRAWRDELAVVVESAPNAVLVTDERGQVVRANRRAVLLLDAPAPALVGTSIDRWLRNGKPFHPDRLVPWLEGVGRDGTARRADGEELPVDVRVGTGEAEGKRMHIVVLMDRAAQQDAEQAMREARTECERSRQAQSEFLSVMSQGIRTPMSRVMGMAHLLSDTSLSPVQQGYVESLMRSSQMMMSFVTDVLDLSKLEAGSLQLVEAPFDVRVAVTEVAALCSPQAEGNGTTLEVRIKDRTPSWVVGDAARFRQVMINLVGNGIKFAPGGRVEIRLEGARDDADVVLKMDVSDNGPGMDAETQRRLLAKDHTTVSKLAGGGLGISMAKHLAELMRGKLVVKSLQGEGTTFTFTLKLKAADAANAPESAHTSALAGTRALIVDSSPGEMQVKREFLRSFGMRVETTTTPEEAMGHLRRAAADGDPVEVALVDRQAIGEHGDTFARRLRADPAIAGVGLLISTPTPSAAEAERLGAAGCDAVLSKPFGAQALSRTLAAVVQKPRAERGRGPIIRGETLSALLHTAPRPASERPDGHIPIVEEPSARRPAAPEVEDTRLRVLLAEDNRVNQIVATNLLQRLGCRVEVVGDGADAVRQASRHEFDVIFMDIQMPNMDGLAATRLIRQLEGTHGTAHIIALGTSASPEERDKYLAAGMDDVVIKPITPEAIQVALERRPAGLERVGGR
jgi:signal transduction histidine kinase/CheY-like chemotaxis protein